MEGHTETMNSENTIKKSPFEDLNRDELIQKCKGLLVIAQKAKLAKNELQGEIENYKLQLEKYQTEKVSYVSNLQTLQELVDSLTEQKLNYITEVDTAHGHIKALKNKCRNYEEEINKYKADIIIKDQTLFDSHKKLSDLDSEIISLKRQNKRLVEENEQLISQLSELESQAMQFKNLGMEQQEQLQLLEAKVLSDDICKPQIEELNKKIKELENELKLKSTENSSEDVKTKELTELYDLEKQKNEKVNIKLRSYKDKILKCASCINQLKNSRLILTKTIKEYSENIPKWQSDILKASKVLDDQMRQLHNENISLKQKYNILEQSYSENTQSDVNYKEIYNNLQNRVSDVCKENEILQTQLNENQVQLNEYAKENKTFKLRIEELEDNTVSANVNVEKINTSTLEMNDKYKMIQIEFNEAKESLSKSLEDNILLRQELDALSNIYKKVKEFEVPLLEDVIKKLRTELDEIKPKCEELKGENSELISLVDQLKFENKTLNKEKSLNNREVDSLNLQLKALESEKAILVKEKLNARDNISELEIRNKTLIEQNDQLLKDIYSSKVQFESILQEKNAVKQNLKLQKDSEFSNLNFKHVELQEHYDLLKKEYENLQDLNGLLKEEVETLKLSLEQPRPDDSENFSDLNASLQTDIVKLETKLSAYKQENASLLTEVKESRAKVKEYDILAAECEDAKTKLLSYKTENAELLNEMKEINEVLKERGEAISKLQKATAEMERLVETLEQDRNSVNQEKNELLNKVLSLENDLKDAKQNRDKSKKESGQTTCEKEETLKLLTEKDNLIMCLKDEIEKIKQQSTSDLPNEDMSTSTISKAEENSRMKDLDETFEEKYTKLRIFALKLKKKLNETVNQLQNAEQDKAKLEKMLNENDKLSTQTSTDEVDGEKVAFISELQTKISTLNESLAASQNLTTEMETLKGDLLMKTQQLGSEIEAHKITKENLEKARRDAKKKNVLSLEMEDYERSMKELTTKMDDNKKKMVQMESTIDNQEGTITAMKIQIKLLEEQIKAEENQNRLCKEELQLAIQDTKDKDNIIQTKNATITKLEQDLEDERRKNEEADLEMTSLLIEKEKHIVNLGEERVELNNKVKRLEFKCGELSETLKITNIELADLKTEYTSYKVRAQAVLRQNQTVDHSQEEQLKEEAAALTAQIEALNAKFTSSQELCSELKAETDLLRKRGSEAANEAARTQQRTARLTADLARLSQELDSERTQHKLQVSTLTQCYKTQISELEAKLQKETEFLRKQLTAVQEASLVSGTSLDHANRNQYMLPIIPKDDSSDGEMDINVSMLPREEGEGSESAPSPPPSKPYLSGGGRSPVPLERLLEEGVPEDEVPDSTSLGLTPEQEIIDLRRRLQAQLQKVKHVTVLLSESERECARMAQLSELLKAELRRARGSSLAAHNPEYMKNVTLKFLTLPPGDERSRLVPVLQKILTLTPDETNKIQAIAKGLDPNPNKGWGSYLPWPGGK